MRAPIPPLEWSERAGLMTVAAATGHTAAWESAVRWQIVHCAAPQLALPTDVGRVLRLVGHAWPEQAYACDSLHLGPTRQIESAAHLAASIGHCRARVRDSDSAGHIADSDAQATRLAHPVLAALECSRKYLGGRLGRHLRLEVRALSDFRD